MHENGVVHRDMNPTTVFINNEDPSSSVKILDFNVSKLVEKPDEVEATEKLLNLNI